MSVLLLILAKDKDNKKLIENVKQTRYTCSLFNFFKINDGKMSNYTKTCMICTKNLHAKVKKKNYVLFEMTKNKQTKKKLVNKKKKIKKTLKLRYPVQVSVWNCLCTPLK